MKLIKHPDPILREPCQAIKEVDIEIKDLANIMASLAPEWKGMGLAAPQVGILKRLLVISTDHLKVVMVNLRIRSASDEKITVPEDCLSCPGQTLRVHRHICVRVEYKDLQGNRMRKSLEGLEAIVAQHEIDHLDGITIIERSQM